MEIDLAATGADKTVYGIKCDGLWVEVSKGVYESLPGERKKDTHISGKPIIDFIYTGGDSFLTTQDK